MSAQSATPRAEAPPHAHPVHLPPLYQDDPAAGRLILRDGSTALIRLVTPEDEAVVRAFFHGLSAESKRHRFFSAGEPRDEELAALCANTAPRAQRTLGVFRLSGKTPRAIAIASYFAKDARSAEVAFAVDDAFQGKGLGSSLLERLVQLGAQQGFTTFWAMTHTDNRLMLEVFHRSGLLRQERVTGAEVELELSLTQTAASAARAEWLDRMFTTASLHPFFQPNAVAVIGASRQMQHIGYRILEALLTGGFQGPVYPVNPNAGVIRCIRAYPTMAAVPERVDLAVIVVRKELVLETVDACAAAGVRALIVISAGFAEVGAEGAARQRALVDKVRGYGMRLIGPNCLGLINTHPAVRLNASFSPVYPPAGQVAMLSQSGALGIAILALARQRHLGLSHFVSVGNKADVSGNDLLQYWEQDAGTNTLLLYLESFGNPRRFGRIARRVSQTKPIIAVKGGRTSSGSRAAGSHTAALAADEVAVNALFRQTGVLRVDTLEEMFDLASVLTAQPLPPGKRVAIVTNAGGPGILCADSCEAGGLIVPALSKETIAQLAAFLPPEAGLSNPVDMIASAGAEHYRRTIATLLASPEIDALLVLYIPVGVVDRQTITQGIAAGIIEGRKQGGMGKPIAACLMGEEGSLPPLAAGVEMIPTYTFPESAGRALARVAGYAQWRALPRGEVLEFDDMNLAEVRVVCAEVLAARGGGWLGAKEAQRLLLASGVPVAPGGVATSAEAAAALARQVGFPVAVKLASHTIVHKTEHGGVALHLRTDADVRQAFERMAQQEGMEGVVVQPMLSGGVELMVGMVDDPAFGPLIAFGLGGIHVEVLRDVSFRIAPLTDRDAREMVREIRGARLLEGYRGHPPVDVAAIEALLLRISMLVDHVPEIAELEFNPVFGLPPGQGCSIVDARIRLAQAPGVAAGSV